MARGKKPIHKLRLTELTVRKAKPQAKAFQIWDSLQRGLGLRVQPTGAKSWVTVYSHHGRSRWLTHGSADAIGLADARLMAAEAVLAVAKGKDPATEKRAERNRGTFAELADQYVEQYAKRHNKSWRQASALVQRHLIPKWGTLQANAITRVDIKAMMVAIAPIAANQTLAAASAIFSWALKEEKLSGVNPCSGIERNAAASRERVLADSEIPKFWVAFDTVDSMQSSALKTILLTGQRPGEVCCMRREHIVDGWWAMPGAPVPELGWPGTKNGQTHRVWLPWPVRGLLGENGQSAGFVFGGKKLDLAMRAVCKAIGAERATPHDLRRTWGTTCTGLGLGREAMDKIMNHKKEQTVTDVYDRHDYSLQMQKVMEAVAARILELTGSNGS